MERHILADAFSHVGFKKEVNEDALYVSSDSRCTILADGMGGRSGGEVAAGICCEIFEKYAEDLKKSISPQNTLYELFQLMSSTIFKRSLERPKFRGMGTSASALFLDGTKAWYAHVGDSRIYLLRNQFLFQVTSDHTMIAQEVRSGRISSTEAKTHPLGHLLNRCLGLYETEAIDTGSIELDFNDRLILCTDGLTNYLEDDQLTTIVNKNFYAPAKSLIDAALENHPNDNLSCVVLGFSQPLRKEVH